MASFLEYSNRDGSDASKLGGIRNPFSGIVSGRPVWTDLTQDSGPDYTSHAHHLVGGQEQIVVIGHSSAPGVLYLDVSAGEGCPWEETDSETVKAERYCEGHAFTVDGEALYRIRFVPSESAPLALQFSSQARPA
jgi:hypothetical protein